MRTAVMAVLSVALLGACRAHPSQVPVIASDSALQELAGRWEGEYSNPAAGRSGSIVFTLQAGSDTAHGDVMMTAHTGPAPVTTGAGVGHPSAAPMSQPLEIAFVRADGGRVTGRMKPYESPDCRCTLTTVFTGQRTGNRIEGTFTASGAPTGPQTGTWSVKRKG